jgi:hypothetical protein
VPADGAFANVNEVDEARRRVARLGARQVAAEAGVVVTNRVDRDQQDVPVAALERIRDG